MIQTQNVDLQGVGQDDQATSYASFGGNAARRPDHDDPFGQHSDVNYDLNTPDAYATFNQRPDGCCAMVCGPGRKKYSIGVTAVLAFLVLFIVLITRGSSSAFAPVSNPTRSYVIQFRLLNTTMEQYHSEQNATDLALTELMETIFASSSANSVEWSKNAAQAPVLVNVVTSNNSEHYQPCTRVPDQPDNYHFDSPLVTFSGEMKGDQKEVNYHVILQAIYPALQKMTNTQYDCVRVGPPLSSTTSSSSTTSAAEVTTTAPAPANPTEVPDTTTSEAEVGNSTTVAPESTITHMETNSTTTLEPDTADTITETTTTNATL